VRFINRPDPTRFFDENANNDQSLTLARSLVLEKDGRSLGGFLHGLQDCT
jgi:hypothetical protein